LEQREDNFTEIEADFMTKANETLVAARRLLKYTYCAAFHLGKDEHSHLGHFQLERLEHFTEELDEASTQQDRTKVLTLIHVVARYSQAVAEFELQAALKVREEGK
jgi:hypothetical protein